MTELIPMVMGIDEFEGTIAVITSVDVSAPSLQQRDSRLTILPVF